MGVGADLHAIVHRPMSIDYFDTFIWWSFVKAMTTAIIGVGHLGSTLAREAISQADTVVLAVWLDKLKQLVAEQSDLLDGKVVVDPTNPVGFDEKGNFVRTLPEHQSSGSVVAELLPPRAHYVKAFGTLGATSLASSANRTPRRAALFYATDDDQAAATVERLISAAGFDPVKAGGLQAAGRIETPGGDLQESGLGRLVDADEARAAIVAGTVA